ncbi:MAG: hypothetical protein Q8O76_11005, partial [Chloroflexota bacterium]|nr:hypothetical protein [Chloroflexota bacterium]
MGRILILPVVALLFLIGALLFFYEARYVPAIQVPSYEDIAFPTFTMGQFTDRVEQRRGTLLVDGAHRNQFEEPELGVFLARMAARGFSIDFWGTIDHRTSPPPEAGQRLSQLEEKLRFADALLVLQSLEPYTPPEIELIKKFVDKGGRLLIVGDPVRWHSL